MAYHNSKCFVATTKMAMADKTDMQELNTKLAQYMQRVCDLKRSAAVGGGSISYNEVMRQIEIEIQKIKALYEGEITKLRYKLEASIKDRNQLYTDVKQSGDLHGRLAEQVKRCKCLEQQVKSLEVVIGQKDADNMALRTSMKHMENEMLKIQKVSMEAGTLKRQLADESSERRGYAEKLKMLDEKHQFALKMHGAQSQEMQGRIKAANEIIASLELKMKQLNSMGGSGGLPAALQKMREGTVAEMKKFQRDTEIALSRNIEALKAQIGDDSRTRDQLSLEKRAMEISMRKMTAEMQQISAKVTALSAENRALRMECENERARCGMVVKELEVKLRYMQETLLSNTKEFACARDAQMSLKAEIETYRKLLNGEACRLKTPRPGSCMNNMNMFVSGRISQAGGGEAVTFSKNMSGGCCNTREIYINTRNASPRSVSSMSRCRSSSPMGKKRLDNRPPFRG